METRHRNAFQRQINRFVFALTSWESYIVFFFTAGYLIGLAPIILGFVGSIYFRPCEWGFNC